MLRALDVLTHLHQLCENFLGFPVVIPILQIRKPRSWEIKALAQGRSKCGTGT